jgi:hypothetical protein
VIFRSLLKRIPMACRGKAPRFVLCLLFVTPLFVTLENVPLAVAVAANSPTQPTFDVPTGWTATLVGSISTTTPNEASKFDLSFTGTEGSCGPDPSLLVPGIVTCNSAVGSTISGSLTGLFFDCADNTYTQIEPVTQGGVVFMTAPDPNDPQVDFGQVQDVSANTGVYTTPQCPANQNSLGLDIQSNNPSDCSSFTLSPSTTIASGSCAGTDLAGENYSFTFTISVSYCGSAPATALAVRAAATASGGDSVDFKPVRNLDTPSKMPDRIPPNPGHETDVPIHVNLPSCSDSSVVISSQGQPSDGTVLINGAKTFTLPPVRGTYTLNLKIRGVTQTEIGRGPHLKLIATEIPKNGGVRTVIGQSKPFVVSAIPINVKGKQIGIATGEWRGFTVQITWGSDSGKVSDLNGVVMNELTDAVLAPPNFPMLARADFIPATTFSPDVHVIRTSFVPAINDTFVIVQQLFMFVDMRSFPPTSAIHPDRNDIAAIDQSGFVISAAAAADPDGHGSNGRTIETTMFSSPVTVKGALIYSMAPLTLSAGPGFTIPAPGITVTQDLGSGRVEH